MESPKIIFQDESILVLDKPAGWVVNEAETAKKTPVIQTWLKKNFNYEIVNSRDLRSGVVHRLDKETSGILLVAKNRKVFESLQLQFKERRVRKTYLALVHGKVVPKIGEIKAPIGRLPWNRERFGILPGGRDALTEYKVISYFFLASELKNNFFSLVEIYPKTGRTHQIRIHLKYQGYPIVSDTFYLGRKLARRDSTLCPRLFLHAKEISFEHPESKKDLTLKSEIPLELKLVLKKLKKIET